jgi:hypothetical protein
VKSPGGTSDGGEGWYGDWRTVPRGDDEAVDPAPAPRTDAAVRALLGREGRKAGGYDGAAREFPSKSSTELFPSVGDAVTHPRGEFDACTSGYRSNVATARADVGRLVRGVAMAAVAVATSLNDNEGGRHTIRSRWKTDGTKTRGFNLPSPSICPLQSKYSGGSAADARREGDGLSKASKAHHALVT